VKRLKDGIRPRRILGLVDQANVAVKIQLFMEDATALYNVGDAITITNTYPFKQYATTSTGKPTATLSLGTKTTSKIQVLSTFPFFLWNINTKMTCLILLNVSACILQHTLFIPTILYYGHCIFNLNTLNV
jgi:hypothetical protein